MWKRDQEYKKANYDQFIFRAKKGKREEYKQVAEKLGLGQMEMFRLAIEEFIANHGGEIIKKSEAEKLTTEDRRLLTAFAKLPKNAQTNLIKTLEALSPQKEE